MVKVPWSKLNDREPVEGGRYLVKVMGYKQAESKAGNPKINWELKIVEPEENENVGKPVWDDTTLTEKAMWRLAWFVGALGIDISKLPDMNTGTEKFYKVLEMCKGRTMWVTVIIDFWEGKARNKITDYSKDESQMDIENIDLDDIPEFVKKKVSEDKANTTASF